MLKEFNRGNELTPKGREQRIGCTLLWLLLLLLHKPSQHLSPLPENVTYSMKRVKGNKASAVSTTSAFTSIQSTFHVQNKTVQHCSGVSQHSAWQYAEFTVGLKQKP